MVRVFTLTANKLSLWFAFFFYFPAISSGETYYLSNILKDLDPTQIQSEKAPEPVQIYFEFQKEGTAVPTITEQMVRHVMDSVSATRLFSKVDTKPVESGSVMSIRINLLAPKDHILGKSLVTGLSFGVIGSTVVNEYECVTEYRSNLLQSPIVGRSRQVMYVKAGLKSAPADAEKFPNLTAAIAKMSRQVIMHAIADIASQPGFAEDAIEK